MNEKFVLKIAGHSATLKEEPTGSKDTGIFLPPELLEFLGGMEKLSFVIYKEDCIAAMASIIVSLPLYSNKGGNKVSHDSILDTHFSYQKAINEFFGSQITAKYEGFKPSITTQNRCYLYGLDKGNFSIRKFLIADYSTLTFVKKEDNTIDLRFKTNVISGRQAPLPIENSLADVETKVINDNKTTMSKALPISTTQIIYYGVPGCGKSYEVNKDINEKLDKYGVTDREYHKVRCVFHPEYCNADFVGQIYPYVKPDNGGVEYRFKPGPFAEIVRRAYRNPAEPFFLIIEEINRGNAAAIFGEIFQLLDRIRPEDGPEELSGNIYDTGWSSYGVTNIDVNAYVRQKSTDNPEKIEYDDSIPYGDKIKFINNTAIRLPPNLSIYATMNTSDQNVFTMDNAFQRRFKSKMIRNSLDNTAQFDLKIGDTGVRWGDFREWINEKILAPETGLKKAEDKCLGGWFIKGEKKTDQNGKVSNESKDFPKDEFAEKVLKYLWNDVFKRSAAENIFLKGKVSSLTNLIELFESGEKFAAFENVFVINAADKDKLLSQKNNP